MPDRYVPLCEIQKKHPEVSPTLAQSWRKFCPWLGRAVKTDPDSVHPLLYSANDFADAFLHRRTEPPKPEFADGRGRWMWTQLLRSDVQRDLKMPNDYTISPPSIKFWKEKGHPALGRNGTSDRKLEVRREWYWPADDTCRYRDYVRREDLDAITAYKSAPPVLASSGWADYSEATEYLSPPTLTAYSKNPHPLLGRPIRPIRTEARKTVTNGQTVTKLFFWRKDLEKITSAKSRPQWCIWSEAVEYGIPVATLEAAASEEVATKKFPVPPKQGVADGEQWHYFRPDLVRLAARLDVQPPGGPAVGREILHGVRHLVRGQHRLSRTQATQHQENQTRFDTAHAKLDSIKQDTKAVRDKAEQGSLFEQPKAAPGADAGDYFHSGHSEDEGEWAGPKSLVVLARAIKQEKRAAKKTLARTGLIQKSREGWIARIDNLRTDWSDAIIVACDG